jgi:glycine cleavage system pyridoxal-binding protein P
MRKASNERHYGNYTAYIETVKQGLAQSMVEGGIFIINIDDSPVKYDSLYDPDLKEFYDRSHLPS